MFCVVSNIIDCIDYYDKVDVLKTVRQLQVCRPEILQHEVYFTFNTHLHIRIFKYKTVTVMQVFMFFLRNFANSHKLISS